MWIGGTLTSAVLLFGAMGCDNSAAAPAGDAQTQTQAVADIPSPPDCCAVELPPRVPLAGGAAAPSQPQTTAEQPAPASDAVPTLDDPKSQAVQANHRPSQWLAPEEREDWDFNFDFRDQDNNAINLTSYHGKPMAMSFIFTRCSNPYMCPLITVQMANLENELAKAGLQDKVNLVLMTYDPVHDTPERLKRYGQDRGLKFTSARLLQPEISQFRQLIYEFGIDAKFSPQGGVADHGMDLYLFDKLGRRVRYYTGGVWDNGAVIQDLRKLLDEPLEAEPTAEAE